MQGRGGVKGRCILQGVSILRCSFDYGHEIIIIFFFGGGLFKAVFFLEESFDKFDCVSNNNKNTGDFSPTRVSYPIVGLQTDGGRVVKGCINELAGR